MPVEDVEKIGQRNYCWTRKGSRDIQSDVSTAVIESQGLTKFYGKLSALQNLELQVGSGEIFGFLGPNGAGKTTFIKILLAFIRPSGGDIRILGDSPERLDRARIGYLPERVSIQPFLTGREFLRYQGRLLGLSGTELANRVDRCLERVELTEAADRRVATYSKGMIQRVGLAQAILGEPELLLLDEPASGLDPIGIARIREIMLEERKRGATVFFNSHQLLEVEKTCDRVAILNRGRLAAQGRSGELSSRQGVTLEVSVTNDALNELIRKYDATANAETTVGGGTRYELSITNDEEERRFPARVVETGARIEKYARHAESLEEIFHRLISAGDTGAAQS